MPAVDFSAQFADLMPALGLGFVLGLLYDAVRILRLCLPLGKGFVFITDVLFVLVCSVSAFVLFLAVNDGRIRLYLVIAIVLGAVSYAFTFGELISSFAKRIASAFQKVFHVLLTPFRFLLGKIRGTGKRNADLSGKKFKKIQNKSKKLLQDEQEVLYNDSD